MRFESVMWLVLAFLLAGGATWSDDATSTQPLQTEEQFVAKDGGTKVPPE